MNALTAGLPTGLDAQVRAILEMIAIRHPVSLRDAGVETARLALERGAVLDRPVPAGVDIRDETIHVSGRGIRIRMYTPTRHARGTVLYFHGGGWVLGSLDTHHSLCGRLADASGATVVSVDYRLAPEHPFPSAVEDALAALAWVTGRLDELGGAGSGLAVAGDSAGGNLAAVAAQQASEATRQRLKLQVLIYPVTDVSGNTAAFASIREFATGLFLTREDMRWFDERYQADPLSPLASPARAASLTGLPRTLIITAEYDPLRDDGEHYAELLRKAGVEVALHRYGGQIHGFMSMSAFVAAATDAMDEVAAAVLDAVR